ncbi:MAG: creatininase family protein [Armatimonadota bacterium]
MSLLFRDQTSPMLAEQIERDALLILPIGTTEEHGPHLPVDTDARIAEGCGMALAEELSNDLPVLLMDSVRYGYSMAVMKQWPGTIVVRTRTFMDYVYDVCGSVLEMGFRKLALLDCHGHHSGLLSTVNRELCDEFDAAVAILSPARLSAEAFNEVRRSEQGGAIHGGEWETSLVLHMSPEVVDMDAAVAEPMRYQSDFVAGDNFMGRQRVTWSTWYLQESESGIYGDPTVASPETGQAIMQSVVGEGARFLYEFRNQK